MPSKIHQLLTGLISRKMQESGYIIVAFDGNDYLFYGQKLNIPPTIIRHRPDIVGYKFDTKEVCIGEAKTENDLRSRRTREQLLDYSRTVLLTSSRPVEIIIGIPKESENDLIQLLNELNLINNNNISYVWLPGELATDDGETYV